MPRRSYIVARSRPWRRRVFEERICTLPGEWIFIDAADALTPYFVEQTAPAMLFFLHWSHRVPASIYGRWSCVCFHMTDLPYGRGGSPLQNLIARGARSTVLTAFQMTGELDAGPVYCKAPMSLDGAAEEIYNRAMDLAAEMIGRIIEEGAEPTPQKGDPVVFARRTPDQSKFPASLSMLGELHDFIRMLDADGYPRAFVDIGPYRVTFSRATLRTERVVADATFTLRTTEDRP